MIFSARTSTTNPMKNNALLLLSITILLVSCKVEPIVPTDVQHVRFGSIDPIQGTVSLDLDLKVRNPNRFAVTVYNMEVDVTIADVPLGKVNIADKFKIEKDTELIYPVRVNAQLQDLIHGIPKLLGAIAKKQSNVQLKGSVKVGSGILRHTFPIDIKRDKVQESQ